MKAILLQENLLPVIQEAGHFISSKPQLPIFSGIALQATSEGVFIRTTDMKSGFQSKVPGKIEEEGQTVVVGKPLTDFLSTLSSGPVEIEYTKDQLLMVKQKRSSAKLQTFPFEDFPPFLPNTEAENEIDKSLLSEMIRKTSYAASVDEARPVLTSILIEPRDGTLVSVCTDGYRLAIQERQISLSSKNPQSFMVQAKTLQEFCRGLTRSNDKKLLFGVSSELQEAFFRSGESTLFLRLIEGKFPGYSAIIPENFLHVITIDGPALQLAIKTASIFARESSSIVTLRFSKNECFVEASSSGVGENSTSVECDYASVDEMKVSFNSRFLLDALGHCDGDDILFSLNEPLKPVCIREKKADDLQNLHIVMPFKK